MGKKYLNPPIAEAFCDFQFIPNQPWDMTVPGLFYEKIRSEFPVKKQQIRFGIGFPLKIDDKNTPIIQPAQRMQFFRQDEKSLIQLAPDRLSVHVLRPYSKWEAFKPMISKALKIYKEIANPKGFNRIGLKYVNKISFDEVSIKLEDYFNFFPSLPKNLPQDQQGFFVKVEMPYNDHNRLLLTLASIIPGGAEKLAILLDLDFVMAVPEAVLLTEADDWIETAHIRVEGAFEECITDKCRVLFGEEK